MSEREWIVVRDRDTFYVVTPREAAEGGRAGIQLTIICLCASLEYAYGYADALSAAVKGLSILPERNG